MNRAERIRRRERYKAKVLRITRLWWSSWTKDEAAVGRIVNHGLQVCSCYMCGNPRRYNKGAMTMQERRAEETFLQEQLDWYEHSADNREVGGSNPSSCTKH